MIEEGESSMYITTLVSEIFSMNVQLALYTVTLEWNLQKPIRDNFLGAVSLRKKKNITASVCQRAEKPGCKDWLSRPPATHSGKSFRSSASMAVPWANTVVD